MLRYKIDVLEALKEKGYSSYVLRRENLIGQKDLQKLRENKMIGFVNLDRVCSMLHCQPGKIIEWVPDPPKDAEDAEQN